MVTVKLINCTLIVVASNGQIFGKVYSTREEALSDYFTASYAFEERGILGKDSCIEN